MRQLVPRQAERKKVIGRATIRPLPDGAALPANLLDLGKTGLALFVASGFTVGTQVEINFAVRGRKLDPGIAVRVGRLVRSRAYPEGNIVGVEFAQPLSDEELRLLEETRVRS